MIFRLVSLIALGGCLGTVYLFESKSLFTGHLRIFHWPAMMLTLIGPMALVSVCSDWRTMLRTLKYAFGANGRKRAGKHDKVARLLQKLSKDFYVEGADCFEKTPKNGMPDFMVKVFDRMANRMPNADVREFLEIERDQFQIRTVQCLHVTSLGVKLTPSIGMLGTILGMVELLSSLSDPAQIGSHMSLALLTTFYGLFFSLVLWTPVQQKIEQILDAELEGYNQAVRWIELLDMRKPANYFGDSLPAEKQTAKKDVA